MAQLKKFYRRLNRDRRPCVFCESPDHPTWAHGKTQQEIFIQLESRRNNPLDALYDGRKTRLPRDPTIESLSRARNWFSKLSTTLNIIPARDRYGLTDEQKTRLIDGKKYDDCPA